MKTTLERTLDQKINSLQAGESIEISRTDNDLYCTVERSGDGKVIRFVRHHGNTETVFKSMNY